MQHRLPFVTIVLGMVALSHPVSAQTSIQTPDSLYLKAQEMVVNGDAVAGRALVDSLLNATSPDSLQYAEALYWHATLAASASTAEQDYRRIIVDYSMSPRVDDALLRMGQLELTRGEYDAALQHLQRVTVEHPQSHLHARASYWIARAFFEKNDLVRACTANADASALVSSSDIELKNQIDYQRQQCRTVATTAAVESTATPPATPRVTPVQGKTAGKSKGAKIPVGKAVGRAKTPGVSVDKSTSPVMRSATQRGSTQQRATPQIDTSQDTDTSEHQERAVQPAQQQVSPDKSTPNPASPLVAKHPAPVGGFTVQVAAYYDRPQADALAAKLLARGYKARVDGTKAPFRVRIGTFPSHAAALTMLGKLKAKQITGFVAKE